jgi:hypothetical protein
LRGRFASEVSQDRCPVVDLRDRLLLNNLEEACGGTGRAGIGKWLALPAKSGACAVLLRGCTS